MRLDNFINEGSQEDPYDVVVEVYNKSLPYIMELIREFHHVDLKTPMLWSGRHNSDIIINSHIRVDRTPKDTSFAAHQYVDGIFHEIFGVFARSASIFVTGKYNMARSYGESVYAIFPNSNRYTIVWSDSIKDLYSDVLDSTEYSYLGEDGLEYLIDRIMSDDGDYTENEVIDRLASEFDSNHNPDDYESEDEYIEARDEYVDERKEQEMRDIADRMAVERKDSMEDSIYRLIKSDYKKGGLKKAIMSGNEIMLSGPSYTGVKYSYVPYILRYMEVHGSKKPNPHLFATAMVGVDFKKFPHTNNNEIRINRERIAKYTSNVK